MGGASGRGGLKSISCTYSIYARDQSASQTEQQWFSSSVHYTHTYPPPPSLFLSICLSRSACMVCVCMCEVIWRHAPPSEDGEEPVATSVWWQPSSAFVGSQTHQEQTCSQEGRHDGRLHVQFNGSQFKHGPLMDRNWSLLLQTKQWNYRCALKCVLIIINSLE